jgi:DNA-binding transcriptional regulator YiaG
VSLAVQSIGRSRRYAVGDERKAAAPRSEKKSHVGPLFLFLSYTLYDILLVVMSELVHFIAIPAFTADWEKLGLTQDDLRKLQRTICEVKSGDVSKEGFSISRFKPPSSPNSSLRVIHGYVTPSHIVFLAVIKKAAPDAPFRLSAADRIRLNRRLISLKSVLGSPTEKRDVIVAPPSEYDEGSIKRLRQEMGVSQSVFAELMGVSKMLAQSWEQGVRGASPLARRLLDVINQDPRGFVEKWSSETVESSDTSESG